MFNKIIIYRLVEFDINIFKNILLVELLWNYLLMFFDLNLCLKFIDYLVDFSWKVYLFYKKNCFFV